jgi:hypothetical protein
MQVAVFFLSTGSKLHLKLNMPNLLRFILICLLPGSLFTSCRKSDQSPDPPTPQLELLRSIAWSNNVRAVLDYNPDSTLKTITYSYQASSSVNRFGFSGKRLAWMSEDERQRKVEYHYNNKGQVERMQGLYQDSISSPHEIRYTYNADGTVATRKFYLIGQTGTTLKTSSTYEYYPNRDLYKVSTSEDDLLATYVIDSYSPECSFNIYTHLELTLSVSDPLYNYPVLNTMKKLPQKITRIVKIGNGEAFTDHIEEITYTISNKQLYKTITRLSFPDHPAGDKITEATYNY